MAIKPYPNPHTHGQSATSASVDQEQFPTEPNCSPSGLTDFLTSQDRVQCPVCDVPA